MPAAPDRACRWNDLEASWSFYPGISVGSLHVAKVPVPSRENWKISIPVWAMDVGLTAIRAINLTAVFRDGH